MLVVRGQSDINTVLYILHRLTENSSVHECEEILFEIVLRLGSLLNAKIDILLQQWFLLEGEHLMHFRYLRPELWNEFEVAIMDDVVRAIKSMGN